MLWEHCTGLFWLFFHYKYSAHILLKIYHGHHMRLKLLLVLSFNSSQIYRSHICTLEKGRRWSWPCQCGPLEMWRSGSGMSRNPWRPHWEITLTAHWKSTLRSATLTLILMFLKCYLLLYRLFVQSVSFCKICVCSFDPSATACRVGVIVAWSSGDSWLPGLLDCWGVWGLGAGRHGQPPLPPTTDTGFMVQY